MIASNEAVAAHCLQAKAPALYRAHEPPEADAVELLDAKLEALDVLTPPCPSTCRRARPPGPRSAPPSWSSARRGPGGRRRGVDDARRRALQQARYDPGVRRPHGKFRPL